MHYIDFKEKLRGFVVFSLNDIKKIQTNFDARRLNEWINKGYIKNIRRGFYIFSDISINEQVLFLIANTIYQPSYISLEMALSLHKLIPEAVYGITSVTSKKTNHFDTTSGSFIYRHIKPELLFGYELREYANHRYLVADIEKTILDYLYLNPNIHSQKDFAALRFNRDEFKSKADINKFRKYLAAFRSQALTNRADRFIHYLHYA